jgi:hypothetical protein
LFYFYFILQFGFPLNGIHNWNYFLLHFSSSRNSFLRRTTPASSA